MENSYKMQQINSLISIEFCPRVQYVLLAVGNGTWAQSSSSRILIPPFIYSTVSSASELKSIEEFNFEITLSNFSTTFAKNDPRSLILYTCKRNSHFSKSKIWKISCICLNFIITWKLCIFSSFQNMIGYNGYNAFISTKSYTQQHITNKS